MFYNNKHTVLLRHHQYLPKVIKPPNTARKGNSN